MRIGLILPSALVLVAVVACNQSESSDPPYTVVDSAGIRIVESARPAWGDSAPRIDPTPMLRIGVRQGEPAYQFSLVRHAQLLSDGHIVVTDMRAHQIRVFDREGRHIETYGGDGEGPGEFRVVVDAFEYSDDSLAAYDHQLRRVSVISRSTGGARVLPTPADQNFVVFGTNPGGPFFLYNPGQYRRDLAPGRQWDSTGVVVMDESDGSHEVVTHLPVTERMIGPGGSREPLIPLRYAVQAVSDRGFYWATPDKYEIRLLDRQGRVLQVLRRPVQPRPVTDDLVAQYIEARVEQRRAADGEDAARQHRQLLQDAALTEHIPLFQQAFVDKDGRLWLGASTWPRVDTVTRQWELFSPTGIWLADIEAPENLLIVDARDDVVLGIWYDDLEVPYVQLHQLIVD